MDIALRIISVGLGSAIIALMAVDFFTTTLSLGGTTGQFTARLSEYIWTAALRFDSRRVLQATGPVMLLLIAFAWLLLAAVGWTLLFQGLAPSSSGGGNEVASLDLVLSFFDTFLGISSEQLGESAVPQWQILRRLMVIHGIATLSLTLAWILPVVRAVAQKRAVALQIAALGTDSQDILLNAWNGEDFGDLDLFLINFSGDVSTLGQLHGAYPVLHYYHSMDDRAALSRQLAVLDETVTLLSDHVEPAVSPSATALGVLRSVLTDYLGMLERTFIPRHDGELPPLETGRVRDAGIPLLDEPVGDVEERRRLLLGYIAHDGIHEHRPGTGDRPERHRDLMPSAVGARRLRSVARPDGDEVEADG